jgi:uncharacterized membrane protein YedE/YeeE
MSARAETYWNPYVAGALLGVVLFLSYLVTGAGLGASGGFARLTAWAVGTVAPEHAATSRELAKMGGGAKNPLDHRMLWLTVGLAVGGFASGMLAGRARVETRKGPRVGSSVKRWGFAILGGVVAGYGARLARGCTSGQALSGGAVLAVGSWAFMFAVFAGGYLLAWPLRRMWT